jgi:hypothetical protein
MKILVPNGNIYICPIILRPTKYLQGDNFNRERSQTCWKPKHFDAVFYKFCSVCTLLNCKVVQVVAFIFLSRQREQFLQRQKPSNFLSDYFVTLPDRTVDTRCRPGAEQPLQGSGAAPATPPALRSNLSALREESSSPALQQESPLIKREAQEIPFEELGVIAPTLN